MLGGTSDVFAIRKGLMPDRARSLPRCLAIEQGRMFDGQVLKHREPYIPPHRNVRNDRAVVQAFPKGRSLF